MAEMSREDFARFRRDAEQRLREMQKRSDEALGRAPVMPEFVKMRDTEADLQPQPEPPKQPQRNPVGGHSLLRMLNFKNINMDADRTLIIAVILLLLGDSSDELLLLALVYIML